MWLQPSFFWMGDLQLGQGLELVTSHRQLAAVLVSSSVPLTGEDKKNQTFFKLIGWYGCCIFYYFPLKNIAFI